MSLIKLIEQYGLQFCTKVSTSSSRSISSLVSVSNDFYTLIYDGLHIKMIHIELVYVLHYNFNVRGHVIFIIFCLYF